MLVMCVTLDPIIEAAVREGEQYLENIARSFTGITVDNCVVEQGQADQIIIEKAARRQRNVDRHGHPRTLRGKALGVGKRNRKGSASFGRPGFGCPGRVRGRCLATYESCRVRVKPFHVVEHEN